MISKVNTNNQNIIAHLRTLLVNLLLGLSMALMAQTQIEILQADELVYDREVGHYQRCIGNVKFKQDQMFMDCDSAWFYEDVNRIEAFGNIYIRQRDSFNLWGNYVEYDGDERIARVEEDVRLTDNKMTLRTERLDYDLNNKSAYYVTGGNIINSDDQLFSVVGTYYSRSKEFHFQENVVLTNPEYEMTSDTLHYNTISKTAYFFGPTYIRSEENTIFCNYGWYNTAKDISQFSNGAYIEGKDNKLFADSMIYDRNTGYGEAYRDIRLVDTAEKMTVFGEYGNYYRFTKKTMITGNPIAVKEMDDDSLYISADTMLDMRDSLDRRSLLAYHVSKVYKSDMQAHADSLVYQFFDSTIVFYSEPVVWTDSSQITGDTILVFRGSKGISRIDAFQNAFLIERDINNYYNQISGKVLNAYFIEGKIDQVHVEGNGQSLYYAMEDSTNYSGVNDIVCGKMIIFINQDKKVKSITFLKTPKATFYPLEKLPSAKSRLEGFEWRTSVRPKLKDFARK